MGILTPVGRDAVARCCRSAYFGPLSGFENAKVDAEFFPAPAAKGEEEDEMPAGRIKSNFLCNLGYGDPAALHPRAPRLGFDETCKLL